MEGIIVNSFSGGRTSGMMTKLVTDKYSNEYKIINIFCILVKSMKKH